MSDLFKVMEDRRSHYALGKEEVISEERLRHIVGHALKYSPTAFNAQEQRLVLLLGAKHDWFWNLAKATLQAIVPPESFPDTEARINGFLGGVGTILLYQDTTVTKGLQESYPMYSDNFPIWAHQASGMLKYTLWTSLIAEGYGANIQHYSELVESDVNKELGIDPAWKMVGQINFGKSLQAPSSDKAFEPLEKRLLVVK